MTKLVDLKLPFWIKSGKGGAKDGEINDLQRFLRRKLPQELVNALGIQDGGVSTYSGYRRGDYYVPLPAILSACLSRV